MLSFNRELKREADRLELIAFKVEGSSVKADTSLKKIDNVEKRITPFEEQLGAINQFDCAKSRKLTQEFYQDCLV